VRTPEPFDLALTVESHGWYDLAPWRWERGRLVLGRPLKLREGRVLYAEVAEAKGGLAFRAVSQGRLSALEAREAKRAFELCLGFDDDLGPFQERVRELEAKRSSLRGSDLPDLRWALSRGAGRLLSSPTVFEDAVKTLCTTNCTWAVTRGLVERLCQTLGEEAPQGGFTFPTPAAMASRKEAFYREVIRAGYRAPFLVELARGVLAGEVDLEGLRGSKEETGELFRRIKALRGFGPYATEHLLRLLGRHDHLALDSWNRKKLQKLRKKRRPPSDRTLRRWYARYGSFAGLAMWLEVTADWHEGAALGV
jgi:N-glycosylase/DNA lyase